MLRPFGLQRLLEMYFGVIGERLAARLLFDKVRRPEGICDPSRRRAMSEPADTGSAAEQGQPRERLPADSESSTRTRIGLTARRFVSLMRISAQPAFDSDAGRSRPPGVGPSLVCAAQGGAGRRFARPRRRSADRPWMTAQ